MKIVKKSPRPAGIRAVVYGVEGIGKTTLASRMPGALFIDIEKGTYGLGVDCINGCEVISIDGMIGIAEELRRDPAHCGYRTLVVDTADALEGRVTADLCEQAKRRSIEDWGYGKGYVVLAEAFARILDKLTALAESGMNVLFLAHSALRKQELPDERGSFDRYECKLCKQVAPRLKEWCDLLAFVNYRTVVETSPTPGGRGKASGGRRTAYTEHSPAWDAKHRAFLEFPAEMTLDDFTKKLARYFGGGAEARPQKEAAVAEAKPQEEAAVAEPEPPPVPEPANAPLDRVRTLMGQYGVDDAALRLYIIKKGVYGDDPPELENFSEKFLQWLIKGFDKIAPQALALAAEQNKE